MMKECLIPFGKALGFGLRDRQVSLKHLVLNLVLIPWLLVSRSERFQIPTGIVVFVLIILPLGVTRGSVDAVLHGVWVSEGCEGFVEEHRALDEIHRARTAGLFLAKRQSVSAS